MQSDSGQDEVIVPLQAEQVEVARKQTTTGRVVISTVKTREEAIDEMLATEHADIERVSIGRIVESMPEVRYEGDTTIIPVVEEVVVVERRLLLKEEVRVRLVRSTVRHRGAYRCMNRTRSSRGTRSPSLYSVTKHLT